MFEFFGKKVARIITILCMLLLLISFTSGMAFLVSLIGSLCLLMTIFSSAISDNRGTNMVTRFVRNTTAYHTYKSNFFLGCIMLGIAILTCLRLHIIMPLVGPIAVVSFAGFRMWQNTHNEQRKKDARGMTKVSLQVAGDAAEGVTGAVAGTATLAATGGNIAAAKAAMNAGKSVGKGVGGIMSQASSAMTDIDVPVINIPKIDADKLVATAERLGVGTKSTDLNVIAKRILELSPKATLAELPDNMSDIEKACCVVNATQM